VGTFDAAGHNRSGPGPFDVPGPVDGISGLSALPNGGFVLLQSSTVGGLAQLYARSFSAAGVPDGQQYAIGTNDQTRSPVILPNGEIVLSRIDGSNSDEVHFQRYDLQGNPIGGEIAPASDGHSVSAARTFALT